MKSKYPVPVKKPLSLPIITRKPPKTTYNTKSKGHFNVDVMIAPGNEFEFVTNKTNSVQPVTTSNEEPNYSYVVDISLLLKEVRWN